MLVKIVTILTIVVVVVIGGYIGYNMAYTFGESEGYGRGYPAGQQVGFNDGKQEGYNQGYSQGQNAGYSAGYSEGSTAGEKKGYTTGYTTGDKDGYARGYTAGKADGYQEGMGAGLGHGYALRDPTYAEALAFMTKDQTDKNQYIEDKYVCSHFSRDLDNNAEAAGLRCAFVEIRYEDSGHTINAFNTVDRGLVYFEPQSDELVKPVVGKRFYQCIEPRAGYYYSVPSFDDTIIDIVVSW